MATLTEVGQLLVDNGYGSMTGSAPTIYGGTFPSTPDNVIALYEQASREPERAMGRLVCDTISVQVLIRNVSYTQARTLAWNIFALLDRYVGSLSGVQYYCILAQTAPFSLGVDENNRSRWTCTYLVRKDRS